MTEHRIEYDAPQHARIIPVNGHTDTNEPLDRLSPRDITAIRAALHLYYGELMECGGDTADLEHLAALSRRLADVSRTWVAEEAQG